MKEPRKFIQAVMGARQIGKSTVVKQVHQDLDMPYHFFCRQYSNHAQRLIAVSRIKQREAIAHLPKGYDSILIPLPQKNGEKTPLKTGENTPKIGKISPTFATPPFSLMFSTFPPPFRLSSTSHLRFTYESLTSKNSR